MWTYSGYLEKVSHNLTDAQIDKLATITPCATGATIKDQVNEAVITAIREGRDVIEWRDAVRAKQLKELGPPEDVEYIGRERHAVAVPGGGSGGDARESGRGRASLDGALGRRIETNLARLLARTERLLDENRHEVLAVADALERHKRAGGTRAP